MIALGSYPATSLKLARARRDAARAQLEAGQNPSSVKAEARDRQGVTFEALAKEWLSRQTFTAKTRSKAEWMLNDLVMPHVGAWPINELTAPEILAVLRRIESRGKLETCHRTKWRIGQIIRYAVATGGPPAPPPPGGEGGGGGGAPGGGGRAPPAPRQGISRGRWRPRRR